MEYISWGNTHRFLPFFNWSVLNTRRNMWQSCTLTGEEWCHQVSLWRWATFGRGIETDIPVRPSTLFELIELSFCYVPLLYIFYSSIFLFWGVKWNIIVTFFPLLYLCLKWEPTSKPNVEKPKSLIIRRKENVNWMPEFLQVMRFVYINNIYTI